MPLTDTDTTSIMSKGSDVIAAHYATIWEALYTMTSPTLGPSDWSL